ncbi:MAG TPA: MBL fold metallo-hydrolase [Anaerolineaceae bacterium]|nr:MBL fold metallo-hydrolase [Anaerolineaceae bacterium]
MTLHLEVFVLGPLENNTILLADPVSRDAVVVDPGLGVVDILSDLKPWRVKQIWLTHAHFDHFIGIRTLQQALGDDLCLGLHPADLPLYQEGGGAAQFNFQLTPGPAPTLSFGHGQILSIGSAGVTVRHTPGHSAGHVLFYVSELALALVGDLIFAGSVGRTDLPGGSQVTLLDSIRSQVLTLPPETRLIPGHGPETTVAMEAETNPFLV